MKNYTKNWKGSSELAPASKRNSQGSSWYRPFLPLIGIAACIFLAVTLRIYYSEKTEELNRQSVRIHRELRKTQNEIVYLKNQRERFSSWKYVNAQLQKYNIALREATSTQVKHLRTLDPAPRRAGRTQGVAAVRGNDSYQYNTTSYINRN